MENHGPAASSSLASTTATAVRSFSKTIAVTYLGLGLFGLILLIGSVYDLRQAVVSRSPLLLIPCAVFLCLVLGFMYVMLALHQRRNWARYTAVSFWLLCLVWTAFTIVRNGFHPQPAPGPLQYSNADQVRTGNRYLASLWLRFFSVASSSEFLGNRALAVSSTSRACAASPACQKLTEI